LVRPAPALLSVEQKRTVEMVHFERSALKEVAERMREFFFKVRHGYYRGLNKLKTYLKSVATMREEESRRSAIQAHLELDKSLY
jgi:hypothetical protein